MLPDPGASVSLTPLADAVLADPVLAESMADARGGAVRALDLTGPAALRPVRRARARRRRPARCSPSPRPPARPRTWSPQLGDLVDPATSATTRLGDAAARAAHPAQRHRRPPARRAAPPRAPRRPTRPTARSRSSSRRSARCSSRRSRGWPTSSRSSWRPATSAAARGRRTPPGRRGVLPGRPGREARRVRGARRHRRRLPADRGAPAAGGVLGRRRRGDPLVRGRRPAHAWRRSTGSGRRRAASCC